MTQTAGAFALDRTADHAADHATPAERGYLEVIYYLAARPEPVISARIARWLQVRPPTVTQTLQRIEVKGLITRDGHGAIHLTDAGRTIAEEVVRRHRLVERFLFDVMGIPWHMIHQEASKLEPVLSPVLEAQMMKLVGDVTDCPHGNPMPGHSTPLTHDTRLSDAPVGSDFVLNRIDEEAGEDTCTLQILWARGLLPGATLTRLPDPSNGLAIRRGDKRIVLSRRVAALLWGRSDADPPATAAPHSA